MDQRPPSMAAAQSSVIVAMRDDILIQHKEFVTNWI
jgi:hypothetical protein